MSPHSLSELEQLSRMLAQNMKRDCHKQVHKYCANAADARVVRTLVATVLGTLGLLWLDERKQQKEGTDISTSTSTTTSSQVQDKPPPPLHN